jgi:uncharacterized protein
VRVEIDKIGPDGLDLDEPVECSWVNETLGTASPFRCVENGHIEVHLDRIEDAVHVRGRTRLALAAQCSRCLGDVSLALDAPVEVTLFPRGQEPTPGEQGELSDEDMGVSTYEGEEIDLASVIHDEVFLELPMVPVCSDECAGLCPVCGGNLNETRCTCAPNPDLRWEGLSRIKLS